MAGRFAARGATVVGIAAVLVQLAVMRPGLQAQSAALPPPGLRLHGMVEPVRSRPISAPRLAGTPGQLIVVRLAKAGTRVKSGDLLVEFDRTSQIKAARDREYEYRDLLAQIEKKNGEEQIARAGRESDLVLADNALRRAELDLLGAEMLPGITAEKNRLIQEEARVKVLQLRKTSDLRNRSAAADLRALEIQRDRAKNAWDHATQNARRMRIESPLDGLVVMKSIWKNGSMGDVQEGEEVRAGIPILDVVDPTEMRVRANVNQADAVYLAPGSPVRITLDSYPARTFDGRVQYVSPVAITSSMSQRVRSFLAVFSVDGTDEHLLPDLAAAIDIAVPPAAAGGSR
ncbi:MAG: efflux RND transporter periplasmic adaptor subunit [Acidobacteriota bacterium]|nr:efflux RND transporter periplasmic adaptor subunit [Acidobacteriota bacterium]